MRSLHRDEGADADAGEAPSYDFPFGGIVSFRIRGAEEAELFLQELRLFVLAESLGGVESLAEVPDRMTHGVSGVFFFLSA